MEEMREAGTDARLDDFRADTARRFDELGRRIDNGFNRMDTDLREMRPEAAAQGKVMNESFEAVNQRFEAMHRLLIQFCGTVIVALIGLIATQL
jgi:hypothetical protein